MKTDDDKRRPQPTAEPTSQGMQFIMPGCERKNTSNEDQRPRQGSLWD